MTIRHSWPALAAALFFTLPAAAQQHDPQHHDPQRHATPAPSPYAGEQARRIKSLADSDITGLLAGAGAAFAKAAELNGYPGPAHVIELREQLGLSPGQLEASQALMAAHKTRARALGQELVDAERRLDALFADRRAQADTVEAATAEVGRISARLRAEHLNTHLQQTALLRPAQVQAYNQFRGYAAPPVVDGGRHPPN